MPVFFSKGSLLFKLSRSLRGSYRRKARFFLLLAVGFSVFCFIPACENSRNPDRAVFKDTEEKSILATDCDFVEPTPEESALHYKTSYTFSTDWFTPQIPAWRGAVGHFRGKPGVQYLEVGLYEGRSAIWMLENILTDPTAHLTGIDVFPGDLEERWMENLERSGKISQATTIRGYSQQALRGQPLDTFDIIYIDGSHTGYNVLADAILAWDLLKVGGVIIFDDYQWRQDIGLPPELKPGPAIDAFITMYRDSLIVIHRCYQLMACKRSNPCFGEEHCSPIGRYRFQWREGVLEYNQLRRPLAENELGFIKTLLNSRRPGRAEITAPDVLMKQEDFIQFVHRINLEFVLPVDPELQRLRELYGPALYSQGDGELFVRDFFKNAWDGSFIDLNVERPREQRRTHFLEKHLGWQELSINNPESTAPDDIPRLDFLNVGAAEANIFLEENPEALDLNPELICIEASEADRTQWIHALTDRSYALIEQYTRLDPGFLYFQRR